MLDLFDSMSTRRFHEHRGQQDRMMPALGLASATKCSGFYLYSVMYLAT